MVRGRATGLETETGSDSSRGRGSLFFSPHVNKTESVDAQCVGPGVARRSEVTVTPSEKSVICEKLGEIVSIIFHFSPLKMIVSIIATLLRK